MKFALDTSVLLAALTESHAFHAEANAVLQQAFQPENRLVVSTHALAELYSTLTVLPVKPRITPTGATRLIRRNVIERASVVPLDESDYSEVLLRISELGLKSGAVYDALHVRAAQKAEADRLYTLNGRDFRRMPPHPPTNLVVL